MNKKIWVMENSLKIINKSDGKLQLSPILLKPEYCEKWNVHLTDFVCLTKNEELVRPTLYRVGGLNTPKLNEDRYIMLIKYSEAFYSKDILDSTGNKNPKHLEGRWCILDKNGNEKVEFKAFSSPYLLENSCIYSLDGKYYNIETGEQYGSTSNAIISTNYLFIENKYDNDKSKRGVMKINKLDGKWELFR